MYSPPSSSAALYRVADIRCIESAAAAKLPAGSLMKTAGRAIANLVQSLIPQIQDHLHEQILGQTPKPILVLAGPGNNGGDALEAAFLLATAGYTVSIILSSGADLFSTEAKQSLQRAQSSSAQFLQTDYFNTATNQSCSLVIDGLFGIGLTRPVTGHVATIITGLNRLSQAGGFPVVAIDVPSGLNADTGQVPRTNPEQAGIAVRATHTITFIANKPGLHTGAGRDYCGQIIVDDLGIDPDLFPTPDGILIHPQMFSGVWQAREHDSNKGSFGEVVIVGGAAGMIGAPLLSARTALHCGTGRVYIGFISTPLLIDSQYPELMCREAKNCSFDGPVLVIGPGLGDSSAAEQLLEQALTQAQAMVIDADALNLIAVRPSLQALLLLRHQRPVATIITPHPLEAARLLGTSTQQIQADRWESARALAKKFMTTVILKGSGTIVTAPDTPISINTSGNPALATAGTGDVLAGICGALLAQHLPPTEAAKLAVWLHGHAADQLVAQGTGPVGLIASELIPAVRACLNQITTIAQ